jgi:hypothetical protein
MILNSDGRVSELTDSSALRSKILDGAIQRWAARSERFTASPGAPGRSRRWPSARELSRTDDTVLQLALSSGYESEAACNREFDLPPPLSQSAAHEGPSIRALGHALARQRKRRAVNQLASQQEPKQA